MKWKEFKKDCRFLVHILLANNITFKWAVFKLSFDCLLWDLRGLQSCPYHGSHAQNLWNGYCKKCGEIPVLPPIEASCIFCSKEKAVLQRASPNYNDKDIWSLCWECDQYITWSFELSWCRQAEDMGLKGKMVKPFDKWLFDKYQVYPKGEYVSAVFRKIENE